MPKPIFAHELVIDAPKGCRSRRGAEVSGHSLHREKSATCGFKAANGNNRALEIRREDRSFKELDRLVKDLSGQDDPATMFVKHAMVQDKWHTSGFGWTTLTYNARRMERSEISADFIACITVLMVELEGRFDLPKSAEENAAFEADIPDVPRLSERRYRCLALYPEEEQAIEILLKLQEEHGEGGPFQDFEAVALQVFHTVDIVPPEEKG